MWACVPDPYMKWDREKSINRQVKAFDSLFPAASGLTLSICEAENRADEESD